MSVSEEEMLAYFFDEFLALRKYALSLGYVRESESWMVWGYEQSLQREEAELWLQTQPDFYPQHAQRLSQLAYQWIDSSPPQLQSLEDECAFFLAMGYFSGLQWSQQISYALYEKLESRLFHWLEREREIRGLLATLLDRQIPHEQQSLLRQRAHLVQILRKQGSPVWKDVREYLFSPEPANLLEDHKKQQWLQEMREWLQEQDIDDLLAMGQGALLRQSRD